MHRVIDHSHIYYLCSIGVKLLIKLVGFESVDVLNNFWIIKTHEVNARVVILSEVSGIDPYIPD